MTPAPVGRGSALSPAAFALTEAASCEVHDVWAWNFDVEFGALLATASAGSVILAFDVEFPGFIRQEPRTGARAVRYQVLRENVDRLRPIQLGVALAGLDGEPLGVWSFNLKFDVDVDLHSAKSVAFLRAAGIDFPRHAAEGIEASVLGQRLAASDLVGWHARAPWWVTFAGFYDFGYLLRMLTREKLPQNFGGFDVTLSTYCPRRHELRDELPHGSLDSLARKHGLQRRGLAHTAGSDALLTLELFLTVAGTKFEMQSQNQTESPSTWWGSTCGMEASAAALQLPSAWTTAGEESWDVQNGMWYQGPAAATWPSWESERWESSWEFQTPVLAAPALLLPR
mmetsp:Transcript_36238/g.91212  ORF Transcript_36238/g.91212 Transcript_36238/m.91212 type:complete len:341 (-) Transcript_36238:186-1208(-)